MDPKELSKRHEKSVAERQRYEGLFDDAIRLTMPARKRFHQTNQVDNSEDIFDETGANAVDEFVSRMQAGLMPPFTNFVSLEADSSINARDRKAINNDLDQITEYMFEEIWRSNLAQESSEAFTDLAISTGCLLHEESRKGSASAFHHKAIPITDFTIERGPDDMLGGVYRVNKIRADQIPFTYPNFVNKGALEQIILREGDKEIELIEWTGVDYKKGPNHFRHMVITKDKSEVLINRNLKGRGSNPFHTFRWSTAAGETWGRGPLLRAMGAIRTTNLMVEMILENAAMNIVGIYQSDSDATINADVVNLLPGTIMNIEPGSRGLQQVNTATGNFNMRDIVLNDQRMNIKKAMYNDMLADPNKTPASATEVAERMADLAYRTSAGFSRVFYEFIQPYTERSLYILEKRGDIQLPTFKGEGIRFRSVSPLAQSQYGRELQNFTQHHQMWAGSFGPQAAAALYKLDELQPWLQKRFALDSRIYKDAKKLGEDMEKAQQQMAEQQQQAGPPQA
jgi:hypothetical protein